MLCLIRASLTKTRSPGSAIEDARKSERVYPKTSAFVRLRTERMRSRKLDSHEADASGSHLLQHARMVEQVRRREIIVAAERSADLDFLGGR